MKSLRSLEEVMHRHLLLYGTLLGLFLGVATATDLCLENCSAPGIGLADSMVNSLTEALNAAKCSLYDADLWPQDYAVQVLQDGGVKEEFDYVVVGAGTAGSVVASRLSENPNVKVLVLEMGDNPPVESEMFTQSNALLNTQYAFQDLAERNPNCCQALATERCFWGRGKMIGGTGSINDNFFLPGNRENFDGWQQAGNRGWSWKDAVHYYTKATEAVGNESHPVGALTLNQYDTLPEYEPLSDLIFSGAQELGIPRIDGLREGHEIGYTLNISGTIAHGRRMSTAKTYLAKVSRDRPNLKVIKNAEAWNIQLDRRLKATRVDFTLQRTHNFSVRARREVLLSAGAFGSPKLLMLSGIGPRNHLQSLGIPVRRHLQVGENLQDHGLMPLFLRIKRGSLSTTAARAAYQNTMDYFLHGQGPLATQFGLMGFINSDINSTNPYPDLQLVTHQVFSAGDQALFKFLGIKPNITEAIQAAVGQDETLVIYGSLLKPKSRGSIRLPSANVYESPRIFNDYAGHVADKAAVVRFVRYVQRLQSTRSFRSYQIELLHVPLEACAQFERDSDSYWLCYAKHFMVSCWHPVGTCKMGPRLDRTAVVDERLRVRGVQGLRVIDASIMPTITGGNTNGPTIMIAEKGSDMVKEDWQRRQIVCGLMLQC